MVEADPLGATVMARKWGVSRAHAQRLIERAQIDSCQAALRGTTLAEDEIRRRAEVVLREFERSHREA